MENSINIQKSNINVIAQLLKLEGLTNQKPILYNQTSKIFKRKFGIELAGCPIVFTANKIIWKLSHITYVHRGRTFESADYLPVVGCGDKFKRIDRTDIYNKIYNIK